MPSDNGGSVYFGPDYIEQIDGFEDRHDDIDNRSEAARRLIDIGLRESQSPLLYRFKDWASNMVFSFILGAVVSLAIGYGTAVMPPDDGIRLAILMLAFALALLGVLEVSRAITGQSHLGAVVRGAFL